MADKKQETPLEENNVPFAELKSQRRFSITWLVPLVAIAIAGWLIYQTVSSSGPVITISFVNAEGLVREKTKIKYREVDIGTVRDISIADDLNGVIVTAELRKSAEKYLTDQTKFWIAKAHVSAKEVRDLGTLLSGAYIGIDPAVVGNQQRQFVGLERPPAITSSRPGRFFVLSSDSLGSLSIGSPILYRQIEVGQVTDYRLKQDRSGVLIDIFVEDPFHELVRENSHFWNASGIQVKLNNTGVEINSDSLISIFLGGITFNSPSQEQTEQASSGEIFQLYREQKDIKDDQYLIKTRFTAYFTDSVRGLEPGATVEFKGIRVGEVEQVVPEVDLAGNNFRVKTILAIEPRRMAPDAPEADNFESTLPLLVEHGLRAQLATDSFLTGQLYVNLDFHKQASDAMIIPGDPYPQIPTVPSTIYQTIAGLTRVLEKIEQVPMDEIGQELRATMDNMNQTLTALKTTLDSASDELSPAVTDTLDQINTTTRNLEAAFDGDSVLQYRLQELLKELQTSSRSVRSLTDYLERRPQSIIFGKEEVKQ